MRPEAPSRRRLAYLSGIPWHFPHRQRQHELARELAHDFDVLFCEPPSMDGDRAVEGRPVDAGVWVHRPWGLFPLGRVVPSLNRIGRLTQSRALASWLSEGKGGGALWIDEDLAGACAGRCGESLVVYDAADLDWAFTRPWNRRHVRRSMNTALTRAGLVISSSQTLAGALGNATSEPVVVPNAGDPDRFRPEGPRAVEVSRLPGPVLGFAGTASARALDLDLLEELARSRPEWSVVLVGMAERCVRQRLAPLANVTMLEPVAYERLPEVVRAFDVCLIPYRRGPRMDYVFPKKVYEYLSAGRPVVATPLPELRAFSSHVRLAANASEFVAAVEAALAEDDAPAAAEARRSASLEHTWQRRGHSVRKLVSARLEAA